MFNKKPILPEELLRDLAVYINKHYEADCDKTLCLTEECVETFSLKKKLRSKTIGTYAAPAPCVPQAASLAEMLRQADAGFTETLLKLIDKTGQKDSAIYKKAGLSKQHFSKIRNNPEYRPTKPTAIALALALELDLEQTKDLIGRAGYTLSNSSKFDLIVRYFIENHVYDIVQINIALYEFDQPLLGA